MVSPEGPGAAPGDAAGPPLADDERAELNRLRREAAEWSRRRPRTGRWVAAIVLLLLGAVLATASVAAVFVRQEVFDTDRYVATVAPLVEEPAVQAELARVLSTEIVTALDLEERIQQLADEAEELGAPELLDVLVAPAADRIEVFLRSELRTLIETEEFAQLWRETNRLAHDELVGLLTTGQGELLRAEGDQIYLDLGAVLELVRQRLVDAGFPFAAEIPTDLSIEYPLLHTDALPRLQDAAYLLDQAGWLLPLLAIGLLLGGVLLAPDHRRGALTAAVAVAAGALLGVAMLALARAYYLDHLPPQVQSRQAAADFYDTITRFLAGWLRTLIGVAVLAAVVVWAAGPGAVPRWVRRQGDRALDTTAAELAGAGLSGPVPRFLLRHRVTVEVAAVIVGVAALLLWRHPGLAGVLWITAAVLLTVVVVELLARAAGHAEAGPDSAPLTPAGR
ncbi:hypothetical protein JQS43_05465 [Natronosporangium hydrolyticum]|uniref:Integral membrane protein n=1 Tax=Natronosporangium hydrolyticum TaxID=2811111 RepID=A0A895YM76_9ACTN|nr:hypothetical protein [Natronosporangium hydrolyticum]QSB15786.1 hypothetical protein JQS43_05465 [Natronosporangium hydrolyticum]